MAANPEVYSRMIAAYVIGFPITNEYLANNPHLKFAKDSVDTGVIISYNTESSAITIINPVLYGLVGKVINPINWRTDETLATKTEGLGSLLPQLPNSDANSQVRSVKCKTKSAKCKLFYTLHLALCI